MYSTLFGGIEAFSTEHFQLVNGFSNQFFGWGGEDDNLYDRLPVYVMFFLNFWLSSIVVILCVTLLSLRVVMPICACMQVCIQYVISLRV